MASSRRRRKSNNNASSSSGGNNKSTKKVSKQEKEEEESTKMMKKKKEKNDPKEKGEEEEEEEKVTLSRKSGDTVITKKSKGIIGQVKTSIKVMQQNDEDEDTSNSSSEDEGKGSEDDDDSEEEGSEGDDDEDDVYDSAEEGMYQHDDDDDDDDEFEDQGSSDDEDDLLERQQDVDEEEEEELQVLDDDDDLAASFAAYETVPRHWRKSEQQQATTKKKRTVQGKTKEEYTENSMSHSNDDSEKTTSSLTDGKNDRSETNGQAQDSSRLLQPNAALWMHTDDLSSDDEDDDGNNNRIGRVPLHWYDDYDHIGYTAHGTKVMKSSHHSTEGGDRIDQALALEQDREAGRFTVHDALNDTNVTLSARQLELIRRLQAGSYAHPEFDGNADHINYVTGDPATREISGLSSGGQIEPKRRFQPSPYEQMQIQKLIRKYRQGKINMDYLRGNIHDMRDAKGKRDPNKPFLLWRPDEDEDEIDDSKGPMHLAAPKLPPPGHAASYRPPEEYLPTAEDLKEWEDLDVPDRPHGLLVPKRFDNLRSVGAYRHSVREAFERCLDLYLCPRQLKRRLNIDPESLVPQLPKPSDLRPFPTVMYMEYKTPHAEGTKAPVIRCLSPSPNGQYLVSGASDGVVRLWEVETSRLLQSWDLNSIVQQHGVSSDDKKNDEQESDDAAVASVSIAAIEWNPNKSHHVVMASAGSCVIILATGTAANTEDALLTTALLSQVGHGAGAIQEKAKEAVHWKALAKMDHHAAALTGPVGVLCMKHPVTSIQWHRKGDYFVSVAPKAAAASVLIHQLSKGQSQQPFGSNKKKQKDGETQAACFHPTKPFLFVASPQHVRIYHLIKQQLVKRLVSGARWISSMRVHPTTGDHVLIGTLDRRLIWFDLDLGTTPYKTLKYHERALRSVAYSTRYPLMASASDDGAVHVFHARVFSDLMRNPLLVPVKVLRGHHSTVIVPPSKKPFGVLDCVFHPTQPWLFTAGADGRILLYQDL